MPDVDDDDFLDDLPPVGTEDDELPDREDLGLEDDDLAAIGEELAEGQDEAIGLDDSAGLDDEASLFELELPPDEERAGGEGEPSDLDSIPVEGLGEDDEYGWTDTGGEDRPASDESWDGSELDLPTLTPLAAEDFGEEGVEDDVELGIRGDDQVSHLPPLDLQEEEDEDDLADDLPIGDDALIDEAALSIEQERRQMGRELPPADRRARVTFHGPREAPLFCLDPGPPLLAAGVGLYELVDGDCRPVGPAMGDAGPLATAELMSVVGLDRGRVLVVGARSGEAFWSADGGARFEPSQGLTEAGVELRGAFRARQEQGSRRLWGRTDSGALYRSDDDGRSFSGPLLLKPVVAIAAPSGGGVIALCAGRDVPSQIARSDDGGQRWTALDGPPLPNELEGGEVALAALADAVVVASDVDPGGPFLSTDRGKTWSRVPGLPETGPVALVEEGGGLTLYAAHFFESVDRGVVARYPLEAGRPSVVLDVSEQAERRSIAAHDDQEGEHRVHALSASRDAGGTTLWVASGAGLFSVRVEPGRTP